jgi:hypothetical protein
MDLYFLQLVYLFPLFFLVLVGFIYFILAYYLIIGFSDSKLKIVLWSSVAAKIIYSLLLSIAQYYIFASNAFTKELLNSPMDAKVPLTFFMQPFSQFLKGHLGYFLYYSWGRFVLGTVLAIICASVFYIFLKLLEKYNPRFFKEGEVKVGFIVSLLVGWPWFIVLIPATFIVTILISIFKKIFFKDVYTTIGMPILVAGIILTVTTYFFSHMLFETFDLLVLKV